MKGDYPSYFLTSTAYGLHVIDNMQLISTTSCLAQQLDKIKVLLSSILFFEMEFVERGTSSHVWNGTLSQPLYKTVRRRRSFNISFCDRD